MKGMEDYPDILEIVKEPGSSYTFGAAWHTDQMFNPQPAKATMLYAHETQMPAVTRCLLTCIWPMTHCLTA